MANHRGPLCCLINHLDPGEHVFLVNRLEQKLASFVCGNPEDTIFFDISIGNIGDTSCQIDPHHWLAGVVLHLGLHVLVSRLHHSLQALKFQLLLLLLSELLLLHHLNGHGK